MTGIKTFGNNSESMETMIRMQNVNLVYPTGTAALKDCSLEIAKGEFVFIVGSSDNGGVSSGDAYATSNYPLRGGKGRHR